MTRRIVEYFKVLGVEARTRYMEAAAAEAWTTRRSPWSGFIRAATRTQML